MTVSHLGFATKVLEGITLVLDRTAQLDIRMEITPRTESITVTTAVPLLDTTESAVKEVIDSRTIDSIPLNGRNYLDLILLTPGVAVNTQARSDLSSLDTNGAIMGERAGNTSFLIDGLENNDDFHGGVFQAFTRMPFRSLRLSTRASKPSSATAQLVSSTSSARAAQTRFTEMHSCSHGMTLWILHDVPIRRPRSATIRLRRNNRSADSPRKGVDFRFCRVGAAEGRHHFSAQHSCLSERR